MNLPAGPAYLYLVVWDMTTGRLGTMTADVDVKEPSTLASKGRVNDRNSVSLTLRRGVVRGRGVRSIRSVVRPCL
jgi:hypothetical protein